jgi:flavin-dependent dehydrogenase
VVYVSCPCAEYDNIRADLDGFMFGLIQQVGSLKDLFRPQDRVGHIMGMREQPNYFRQSYGEGWALVGDAGYLKDPIVAQGISDALRSAEWLADAAHKGLSGSQPLTEALADYQRTRDENLMPMFDFSCMMAALEDPPPEIQALLGALQNNPVERDRYFGMYGGLVPHAEFLAPENIQRIVAGTA